MRVNGKQLKGKGKEADGTFLIDCALKQKCMSISGQQMSQAAVAKDRCFCGYSIYACF